MNTITELLKSGVVLGDEHQVDDPDDPGLDQIGERRGDLAGEPVLGEPDDDDLDRTVVLGQRALEGGAEVPLAVVGRHDHADAGDRHRLYPPSSRREMTSGI